MSALIAAGRSAGCECLALNVWADNEPAITLYRRHGFTLARQEVLSDRIECRFELNLSRVAAIGKTVARE